MTVIVGIVCCFMAFLTLAGTIATAHLRAKRDRQFTEIDREAKEIDSFRAICEGFSKRLADLEADLRDTRNLLRVSLHHIQAVVLWYAGDREDPIPPVPNELIGHF